MSNAGFIVPITDTFGKMVDRAAEEYSLLNMDEAPAIATEDKPLVKLFLSRATMPLEIAYVLDLREEPHLSCRRRCSPFCYNICQTSVSKVLFRYSKSNLTIFPSGRANEVVFKGMHDTAKVVIYQNCGEPSLSRPTHAIQKPLAAVAIICPTGPNT